MEDLSLIKRIKNIRVTDITCLGSRRQSFYKQITENDIYFWEVNSANYRANI